MLPPSLPSAALTLAATFGFCWFGAVTQALVWPDGTRHVLAESDTLFATYFNFKNDFPCGFVLNNLHVTVLQVLGLIGPEAGIGQKQHVIVHLLGIPLEVIVKGFF